MNTAIAAVLLAAALSTAPEAPPAGPASAAPTLVIRNVHVIDVAAGIASGLVEVAIEGQRIAAVRAPGRSEGAPQVSFDAGGGYLVPGFWDMHAHVNMPPLAEQWTLPLMLVAGVTGVRDMNGDCFAPGCAESIGNMRKIQARIDRGELLGPRIVAIGSAIVDGPRAREPQVPDWAAPNDAAAARRIAGELAARHVDFIKPYDLLPRAAYFELAHAARRNGLALSGHVPMAVSSVAAARVGQRTIEHAKHPAIDCSGYARRFRSTVARWAAGRSPRIYQSWADGARGDVNIGGYYQPLLAAYDEKLCDRVIAALAATDVYYVPTLVTRRFEAIADDPVLLDDPRLARVPPDLRAAWQADAERLRARFAASPAEKRAYTELYELAVRLTGRMHAAGVPVLIGTDSPDSWCFPGSGVADEMRELARAGLPPAAILRAATLNAAEFSGRTEDHGTIAPGKIADLVLLPGNPLDDLANVAEPRAVVLGGRLLDGAALREITERAVAAAADTLTIR